MLFRSNPAIIYAAAVDVSSGLYAIYKTINSGVAWNLQYNALNILSYDDGTAPGGQGNYDLGFTVDPLNPNHLFIGGVNIWSSTDGGLNFDPATHWTTQYGNSIHGDIHYITYQPLTSKYFVGSDGGVYRTSNIVSETWTNINLGSLWPTVWENMNSGMQVSSFYRISSSRSTSNELVGGVQDNASMYFDGTTRSEERRVGKECRL